MNATQGSSVAGCARVVSLYERSNGLPLAAHDVARELGVSQRTLFRKLASISDAVFWDHYTFHLPKLARSLEARRADVFSDVLLELTDLVRSSASPFEVRRERVVRSSLVLEDRRVVLMGRYRQLIAGSLRASTGVSAVLADVAASGVMAMLAPAAAIVSAGAGDEDTIASFVHNAEAIRDATRTESDAPRVYVIDSQLTAPEIAERLDARLSRSRVG